MNTNHLFNRTPTCHEAGICQRTTPRCHRVCHLVPPDKADPPLGYEAATPVAWLSGATQRQEQQDAEPDCWAEIGRWIVAVACAAGVLGLLGGIAFSLIYPGPIVSGLF